MNIRRKWQISKAFWKFSQSNTLLIQHCFHVFCSTVWILLSSMWHYDDDIEKPLELTISFHFLPTKIGFLSGFIFQVHFFLMLTLIWHIWDVHHFICSCLFFKNDHYNMASEAVRQVLTALDIVNVIFEVTWIVFKAKLRILRSSLSKRGIRT